MCPPPRGAQGRAVAWKQAALAAHTQTFVTISRTFYSSSFLAGARPGTQVRSCSQHHPQPQAQGTCWGGAVGGGSGLRWGRGRQMRERRGEPVAGEMGLRGRPSRGLEQS